MKRTITLTEEEAGELEDLIRSDLQETHSELRRTRNPDYRDRVNNHLKRLQHVHELLTGEETPSA